VQVKQVAKKLVIPACSYPLDQGLLLQSEDGAASQKGGVVPAFNAMLAVHVRVIQLHRRPVTSF